jgi:hypothetical protein
MVYINNRNTYKIKQMGKNLQTETNCQQWTVCHKAISIFMDRTLYGSDGCILTPSKPATHNEVP